MAAGGAGPVAIVSQSSPHYPDRLRRTHHPPSVIYVRGTVHADEPAVAVVGSRRATPAGRVVAERIAAGLARRGIAVVSGLARGIDAVAHQSALDAGGRTIAVLGCGADVIYPPEHAALLDAIVAQGAVISEFPLGTPPRRAHFPQRNRIIAGLCLGVVVVEGDGRSGTLSTAGWALEAGREVMAVPGSVLNPLSRAPHALLREGAALVETAEDVLAVVGLAASREPGRAHPKDAPSGPAALVWEAMGTEPVHIDQIARAARLPSGEVAALLTELELRGLVRQFPGKHFIRA